MSLRRISEIQQLPVMDIESGEILGEVVSWTIQPTAGKIAAFILERPRLWKKAQVIVPPDIIEYGPRMVVVKNIEAVVEPDEIVGLPELLTRPIAVVGFLALTESGKILGRVTDFVFEIISSTIQQYYVQPPGGLDSWRGEYILPAGKLIRIEKDHLVFPDDVLIQSQLIVEPGAQMS